MPNTDKHSADYIAKSFVAGGIAGLCAKTVIAPLDRVKILFQTQHPLFERYSGTFLGGFVGIRRILDTHGVGGLFRGHSATVLRIFPYAAIKFMAYEQIKGALMPSKEYESAIRKFVAGSLAGSLGN